MRLVPYFKYRLGSEAFALVQPLQWEKHDTSCLKGQYRTSLMLLYPLYELTRLLQSHECSAQMALSHASLS